jgi:hypothetical protein
MLAVTLLAMGTITVLTTMVYSSSTARLNSNAIAAKNIAQGYFERMAIDEFADISAASYPDIPIPADLDLEDANAIWLDRALLIPCQVTFEFKGFGVIEAGSLSGLTDDDADWTANEWAGDAVFIIDGKGAGQFVRIASNTATALTFEENLAFAPGVGARYMVNNGKTAEITTTWTYRGKQYQQTIESLVPNYRNDDALGF